MNILHLIRDDKFIKFIQRVFGNLPRVRNRWLVRPNAANDLKHTSSQGVWRLVDTSYFFSRQMYRDLEWSDCLVIHSLGPKAARMILSAPSHVVVVWSGWGADYYGLLPGGVDSFLGNETRRLLKSIRRYTYFSNAVRFSRECARKIAERAFVMRAIKRIDLISAPLPEDIELLRSALGARLRAEYIQLNYGSVEQTFQPGSDTPIGRDILLGNSATPTNNHIEVLQMLAKRDLADRRIIVPLSYGDADYRDAIVAEGSRLLGKTFVPILKFVPLSEYNTMISSCSAVIMNHHRQQGLANIGSMIFRGARVFLDERNVVFQFLKSRGAHVFATRSLEQQDDSIFLPVSNIQKAENRLLLTEFWGDLVVNRNAMQFLERVKEVRAQRSVLATSVS